MNWFKENSVAVFTNIFELLAGVLLLINPLESAVKIVTAFGVFLVLLGITCIVRYFKSFPQRAAVEQTMAKGLIAFLLGGFCLLNYSWSTSFLSELKFFYGIAVLFLGISRIQIGCDMIRMKKERWRLTFLSAAVALLCAAVILWNPFTSATLWRFVGVSLIIAAVFDFIALFAAKNTRA